MVLTAEERFKPYEMLVESYKKDRNPETLELLLELQRVYNKYRWAEVYRIDEDGIPHYRVKEEFRDVSGKC